MFWMSWIYATVTIAILVVLGLYVFWANPEANWGSSTQGQTFVTALKSVREVTGWYIYSPGLRMVYLIRRKSFCVI